VKTGVQMVCNCLKGLDSGFRRNDGKRYFPTFYKTINFKSYTFTLKSDMKFYLQIWLQKSKIKLFYKTIIITSQTNMSSSKIAFIVNPNAGNGSTGTKWPFIKTLAENRLGSFKTYITAWPGDAAVFAKDAVAKGISLIVCVGGDGTQTRL